MTNDDFPLWNITFTPVPSRPAVEYRYTAADGVEPWMIGKSPTEVWRITEQLARQLFASGTLSATEEFAMRRLLRASWRS